MRTIRSILFLAILGIALSACAGSAAQAPVGADAAVGDSASRAGGTGVTTGPLPAAGGDLAGTAIATVDDAKIIRTGTMDLQVSDVQAAVKAARSAILAMGGYVGASNAGTKGDTPFAEISYRIPADRWEDALAALRDLGGLTSKVVSEQTQAVEVTGQVVDLEARIKNLQASETALQGIAGRATKITDVLEVQAQLTTVRGQIEELTAQLKDLNDRATYATLSATYSAPVVAVQVATKGWDPAAAVDQALASLVSIVQHVADAGIWFVIVWLPVLIVFVVVAAIAIAIARRTGLGRRAPMPPAPPAELPTAG